jgi:flotillin
MPATNVLVAIAMILIFLVFIVPALVAMFLRDVPAGSIRIVTWWGGKTHIYRGPGKSYEIPLLTNGTSLSSKAINVDLDITDQTADIDERGVPQPIKVRVLASAIVSVGDTDQLIKTAANRFFAKPEDEQLNTITDLLSSSGRRAVNLLTHDQLFSAKTAPRPGTATALAAPVDPGFALEEAPVLVDRDAAAQVAEDDDDPLAIIIRKACSRELTDLGLIFNSLNIKVVQSEVAEARRRMSAAEAAANADIVASQQTRRAQEAQLAAQRSISDSQRELEQTRASNAGLIAQAEILKLQAQEIAETKRREAVAEATAGADIVSAQQNRRAKEAQLEAERAISDSQRELEQTRLANAVLIAQAEAQKQDALAGQRESELRATQIAQAAADAERVHIEAKAAAEAEALRITTIAQANAESIRQIHQAIEEGGDSYLRYRQVEMLPEIVPMIANALAEAKLVTICSGHDADGAAGATTDNITGVIRTVLAAQLVSRNDLIGRSSDSRDAK